MGKTVKAVVGFVVAVGLVVAGVVTGNPQLIMAGLTIGLSTLKSLKGPKTSPAATDRLQASIDPRAARKGAFGDTALNTDIRDQEYTGHDKEYFHRFVVAASHKLTSIREIWFDDKIAWTAAGGAQGEFAGYLTVATVLEGNAGNAINISARMGATRRYTGCGYVHFRYKLTGNSKKTESPFASSVPSRVTIVGEGMPVYDPRYDSTVPGGVGPARADDQTTWQYSYSGSNSGRNPACQTVTYLLGWRIKNPATNAWKLALGKGVPSARIDLPSFITAANLCDETVTLAAGGTEPRYRSDGVFSEFDQATDVLDNLKAAMSAELDDVDGLIRVTVLHNDLAVPVLNITDDDVLGDFTWSPYPSLEQSRNVIRGSYVDKRPQSLYQMVPYPDVVLPSPDGIERPEPVNYQFVQSVSQAQRLSKQRLQRAQYGGTFAAEFKSRLWKAIRTDVVAFTFGPTAFVGKLFRIVDTDVAVAGRVAVTLREEHPNTYLWDSEDKPAVVAVDATPYTNFDLPLSQFLDTVETGANVTEDHTAANTVAVGTRTAGAVNLDIDTAQDDIDDLQTTTTAQGLSLSQILLNVADLQTTYGTSASAATSAAAAASYASTAQTASTNAATANTAAQAARTAAETASAGASTARTAAESASATAITAQGVALSARDAAQGYATAANTAQGLADTARTAAQTARNAAQTAQTQAETAASNAVAQAGAASGSATAAAGSATTATQKADAAAGSATAAAGSATAASTSAGNASTSASQAATSSTNASGSASAAATSATTAATARDAAITARDASQGYASAASTSASNAATSATAAGTSATAANTSATNANTSAGNAATSAGQASTSATNASGSASAASTSATTAATARDAATVAATAALPSTFEQDSRFFSTNAANILAQPRAALSALHTFPNVAGVGKVLRFSGGTTTFSYVGGSAYLRIVAGRSYRASARERVIAGDAESFYIMLNLYDASGALVGSVQPPAPPNLTVAAGWVDFSYQWTAAELFAAQASAVYVAAGALLNHPTRTNVNNAQEVQFIRLEDVTESTTAAASATAATTSASNAAASSTTAGQQAAAASTSATNASTSAGQASTSAGQASTSATNAAGSASQAATSATTSATARDASISARDAALGYRDGAQGYANAASTSASNASASATTASQQATAASTSATNANTSAGNASTSAGQASTSATNASGSASAASTSATTAATARDAAITARDAALGYRDNAQSSATAAATSASNASASATTASQQATAASTSATNADTSRSQAATSASQASTSATSAAASESAASTSASTSATARDAAITARDAAQGYATNASNSATAAATSASNASASATTAGQQATAASTSATNANTSAGNAATSATNASTSASNAAGSASAASTSATTAAGARDTATQQASLTIPTRFDATATYFGTPSTSSAGTVNQSPAALAVTVVSQVVNQAGYGYVYSLQASGYICNRGMIPVAAGRVVEVTYEFEISALVGTISIRPGHQALNAALNTVGIGEIITNYNANGIYTVTRLFSDVANAGQNISAWIAGAAWVRGNIRYTAAAGNSATVYLRQLGIADVTARVAAANSASAAATSASTASTSATNAGTSATAASGSATTAATSAGNASTSAGQASTSATNASGSASAAATSASTAATARDAATAARDSAQGYASAASTSASNASGSADAAGASAAAASSSATTASTAAGNANTYAGQASTSATNASGSANTASTQAGNAATSASAASGSASAASGSASTAGTAATNAGNSATAASGSANTASTAAGNANTYAGNASSSASSAASSATAASGSATAASGSANTASTAAGNANTYAGNASSSASAAASSATAASGSATAASGSANTASTQAGNAATSASAAASSAASASGSAASALSSAYLAASISLGALNKNAQFQQYTATSGVPDLWTNNGGGDVATRTTGEVGGYAMSMVGAAASVASIYTDIGSTAVAAIQPNQWLVMFADVRLVSGGFAGAGIFAEIRGTDNAVKLTSYLTFATDKDTTDSVVGAGTAGRVYRFRKLFQAAHASAFWGRFYAATHSSTFGSIAAANNLTWYDAGIRAATDAEIAAQKATADIATLQASVSSNSGAITTLQGRALAYLQQVVNAGSSATAFLELRAETSPGSVTSSVALGAREVHIYTDAGGGGWKKTLSITGSDVLVDASLTATAGIFLGTGIRWRVALATRDFQVTDGTAVAFGYDLGNAPLFSFKADNLAPLSAGETYKLYADSVTGTGFTPRLRIATPGTTAAYNLTVDTAPGTGPTRQIDKAANPDASNNVYRVRFQGTFTANSYFVGSTGGGGWGTGGGNIP